jgi:hypothetical protein
MRTPAGKECRHYYEDFHRGRDKQECRLVKANPASEAWLPADCSKCPVPDILRANADPDMELIVTIKAGFLGFFRRVEVTARDAVDGTPIADPYVGRTKDNPKLDLFRQALAEIDDSKDQTP